MIKSKDILDGIKCRQLGKMYSNDYKHPLKWFTVHNEKTISSGNNLKTTADEIACEAQAMLSNYFSKGIRNASHTELVSDNLLQQQLGEIETVRMVKETRRASTDLVGLIHRWGCNTFRDIVQKGMDNRQIVSICRKTLKSVYFRLVKTAIQNGIL